MKTRRKFFILDVIKYFNKLLFNMLIFWIIFSIMILPVSSSHAYLLQGLQSQQGSSKLPLYKKSDPALSLNNVFLGKKRNQGSENPVPFFISYMTEESDFYEGLSFLMEGDIIAFQENIGKYFNILKQVEIPSEMEESYVQEIDNYTIQVEEIDSGKWSLKLSEKLNGEEVERLVGEYEKKDQYGKSEFVLEIPGNLDNEHESSNYKERIKFVFYSSADGKNGTLEFLYKKVNEDGEQIGESIKYYHNIFLTDNNVILQTISTISTEEGIERLLVDVYNKANQGFEMAIHSSIFKDEDSSKQKIAEDMWIFLDEEGIGLTNEEKEDFLNSEGIPVISSVFGIGKSEESGKIEIGLLTDIDWQDISTNLHTEENLKLAQALLSVAGEGQLEEDSDIFYETFKSVETEMVGQIMWVAEDEEGNLVFNRRTPSGNLKQIVLEKENEDIYNVYHPVQETEVLKKSLFHRLNVYYNFARQSSSLLYLDNNDISSLNPENLMEYIQQSLDVQLENTYYDAMYKNGIIEISLQELEDSMKTLGLDDTTLSVMGIMLKDDEKSSVINSADISWEEVIKRNLEIYFSNNGYKEVGSVDALTENGSDEDEREARFFLRDDKVVIRPGNRRLFKGKVELVDYEGGQMLRYFDEPYNEESYYIMEDGTQKDLVRLFGYDTNYSTGISGYFDQFKEEIDGKVIKVSTDSGGKIRCIGVYQQGEAYEFIYPENEEFSPEDFDLDSLRESSLVVELEKTKDLFIGMMGSEGYSLVDVAEFDNEEEIKNILEEGEFAIKGDDVYINLWSEEDYFIEDRSFLSAIYVNREGRDVLKIPLSNFPSVAGEQFNIVNFVSGSGINKDVLDPEDIPISSLTDVRELVPGYRVGTPSVEGEYNGKRTIFTDEWDLVLQQKEIIVYKYDKEGMLTKIQYSFKDEESAEEAYQNFQSSVELEEQLQYNSGTTTYSVYSFSDLGIENVEVVSMDPDSVPFRLPSGARLRIPEIGLGDGSYLESEKERISQITNYYELIEEKGVPFIGDNEDVLRDYFALLENEGYDYYNYVKDSQVIADKINSGFISKTMEFAVPSPLMVLNSNLGMNVSEGEIFTYEPYYFKVRNEDTGEDLLCYRSQFQFGVSSDNMGEVEIVVKDNPDIEGDSEIVSINIYTETFSKSVEGFAYYKIEYRPQEEKMILFNTSSKEAFVLEDVSMFENIPSGEYLEAVFENGGNINLNLTNVESDSEDRKEAAEDNLLLGFLNLQTSSPIAGSNAFEKIKDIEQIRIFAESIDEIKSNSEGIEQPPVLNLEGFQKEGDFESIQTVAVLREFTVDDLRYLGENFWGKTKNKFEDFVKGGGKGLFGAGAWLSNQGTKIGNWLDDKVPGINIPNDRGVDIYGSDIELHLSAGDIAYENGWISLSRNWSHNFDNIDGFNNWLEQMGVDTEKNSDEIEKAFGKMGGKWVDFKEAMENLEDITECNLVFDVGEDFIPVPGQIKFDNEDIELEGGDIVAIAASVLAIGLDIAGVGLLIPDEGFIAAMSGNYVIKMITRAAKTTAYFQVINPVLGYTRNVMPWNKGDKNKYEFTLKKYLEGFGEGYINSYVYSLGFFAMYPALTMGTQLLGKGIAASNLPFLSKMVRTQSNLSGTLGPISIRNPKAIGYFMFSEGFIEEVIGPPFMEWAAGRLPGDYLQNYVIPKATLLHGEESLYGSSAEFMGDPFIIPYNLIFP